MTGISNVAVVKIMSLKYWNSFFEKGFKKWTFAIWFSCRRSFKETTAIIVFIEIVVQSIIYLISKWPFKKSLKKKLAFLSYSIPLKVIKVGVLNYFGLNDHSMGRGSWKKELMELNFTFGFWFYNSKRPHSFSNCNFKSKT